MKLIKKSIISKLLAWFEVFKIKLKTSIKKLKISLLINKLKEGFIKNNQEDTETEYTIEDVKPSTLFDNPNTVIIDYDNEESKVTKRILFDFLYSNIESLDDVTVYKSIENEKLFFIKGKIKTSKLEFINIKN